MTHLEKPSKWKSMEQRWEWHLAFMVLEDPFVHRMLLLMSKRADPSIGTMGVCVKDDKLCLSYSPEFFNSLTDPQVRFVLTHEIYHLALHHCTSRKPKDPREHMMHNIAQDMAINSLIKESPQRQVPTDKEGKKMGVFPKDKGWPDKLSYEQYLQLIRENPDKCPELGEKGNGGGKGNNKTPGEGDSESYDGSFDNHDQWGDSQVVKEKVRAKIDQLAKSEKAWGNTPSDVMEIIKAAQKSKVNWRQLLNTFIGQCISTIRRTTMKKPNRRFGWPIPGKRKKYVGKALACVDTSGSMNDKMLAQVISEVNKLTDYQPVDLCMFDADIEWGPEEWDGSKIEFKAVGRGGTSFEPPLKLAEEQRYTTVIMLTDGYASAPEKPKYVKDVIWIIVDGKCPVDWGKIVNIDSSVGYSISKDD